MATRTKSRTTNRNTPTAPPVGVPSGANWAGGMLSVIGAITMTVGGGVYTTAGADLWGFVDSDVGVDAYMADAAAAVSTLHATHAMWIAGVFILAIGGILLTRGGPDTLSVAARASYMIGAALAIPAFLAMVALTRLAESGTDAPGLAESLGFLGARTDDVATVVIIGLGPLLISLANRDGWMPAWLVRIGMVAGLAGAASLVSLFFGAAGTIGFIIVPIGMVWSIAAGAITIRQA